jgi:hypothetical protein
MKGIEIGKVKQASENKPVTEEIKEFVEKKEKQTKSLPDVEDKYQTVANVKYIKDKQARLDVFAIIDEISKFEQCNLFKTSDHDLSVRVQGKQVLRLCPLKKGWSASIRGEKIQKYTKEELLSKVKDAIEEGMPKISKQDDNGVITKLEERINKMSKDSKGISIKGIKLTKEIRKWAKQKGYSLTGETLLVN